MSLQQFLIDNRMELIERTRKKVANRSAAQPIEVQVENGIPIFLSQVVAALGEDCERNPEQKATSPVPQNADIARTAILRGQSMRQFGFTIDQVVRGYGDVCQAVTEMADEREASITATEFHMLNWCLDNAIARAVTSWNDERDKSRAEGKGRRDLELLNLVMTATFSFEALRSGRVGSTGATATVIQRCLAEMRVLLDDPKRDEG